MYPFLKGRTGNEREQTDRGKCAFLPDEIYYDNSATTRTREESAKLVYEMLTDCYGNPSSLHRRGFLAQQRLDKAREQTAATLGCQSGEIYFTSGGTESDNWAIMGAAFAGFRKGNHIITTKIEHPAVKNICRYLEHFGFDITWMDVDRNGFVKPEEIEKAVRKDTILISVMTANNEIGTIQPVYEIGKIAKHHKVIFHTDAVQAFCHEPINVDEYHIDMLSASGHKFHGPKGVGFLYIRKGLKLRSFIHGGAQERKRRAGTENVPGIVGLGKAVEIGMAELENNKKKETELRDYLIGRVMDEIPYTRLNGHRTNRLSNNANFAFQFIEGESLLIMLDMDGICGSSGSACTSGSLDPSHVLLAIGLPHEIAHGSLRLTLSEETTKEEIDHTVDCLKKIVEKLRAMSPLYEDFIKKNRK